MAVVKVNVLKITDMSQPEFIGGYMLRRIMIFPQFDNIEVINRIREKYDPLAKVVRPHITLVFPFDSEITNKQLEVALNSCVNEKSFEIVMHGFSKQVDRFGNYLFLDMEKGNDIVENLHNKLYKEYFKAYDLGLPYKPHITVGKMDDTQALNKAFESISGIDDRFRAVIDKISVEMIGENEESIIVIEKKLF